MLVNSKKEGQDKKAAMLTNVGNIVEVRYNKSKKLIEFYSNDGFLGSTASKQKIEGYARVIKVESLFKGYHFILEYSPFLSKKDFDEDSKKKEEIIQTNIKNKKAREEIISQHIASVKLPSQLTNRQGRVTVCWKCGEELTSQTHSVCSSCNWLICSCGACRRGCSSSNYLEGRLSEIANNKYREESLSEITDGKYQKCSVNDCIAKIPKIKAIEWNGRCPRHKHY